MEKTIYIKLLDEESIAYRPVLAIEIDKDIYSVVVYDSYDHPDETWEFSPGRLLKVIEQTLNGEEFLVAVSLYE